MGKREAYQEKTEAQFQELDAQIELCKAEVQKADADVKREYNRQLASLDTKSEILVTRL